MWLFNFILRFSYLVFYLVHVFICRVKEQMIQVQSIQVEISTTTRGDLHALFTSTFHFPAVVLSDVFGVQAGMRAKYHRLQQTSVGKRQQPRLLALLLQAGTHGWHRRRTVVGLNLVLVPSLSFLSSPNCLTFTVIDWLIPLMNSSSYQSPWRPRVPCCSRQDRVKCPQT